tara:strand:- start:710 stop:1642 length:933 start_codon:yes stop_codon:yes gene_type:complete
MPIYYGDEAITYLGKKVKQQDPKSSSHWNMHHSNFSFDGKIFSGVTGFGSNENQYKGLRKIVNYLFQIPFRKIGKKFSEFDDIDKVAKDILKMNNKAYSLDVLRQVISLAYLKDKGVVKDQGLGCVIGDGFATMTSLLLKCSNQKVVLVNLVKTLLMDLWQLKLVLGDKFNTDVAFVEKKSDMLKILSLSGKGPLVVVVEAENHQLIQECPIDLVINIASMQEMNPEVVAEYFNDISIAAKKHKSFFYCCNRKNKELPDGTIVNFEDYPWHLSSKVLDDELCPWHQKYYSFRPPFYHDYDGVHKHRLIEF